MMYLRCHFCGARLKDADVTQPLCQDCGSHEADMVNEGSPVCDFCSGTPVVKSYEAEDHRQADFHHEKGVLQLNSMGGWAACEVCAAFIDANDRDGLVKYSSRSLNSMLPKELQAIGEVSVRRAHDAFFASRKKE